MRFFAAHGLELDVEAAARHAQRLHFLLHCSGQALGSIAAQCAELGGFLLVMALIGGQLFGQAFTGLVVGIQAFKLLEQLLLQGGQLGGLDAMLACQGVDGVQALFEKLLTLRVGVEVIEEAIQLADCFFDLDLRTGQQVAGFVQGAALAAKGAQAVEAGGQRGEHVAGIALAAQIEHLATGRE